MKQKEAATLAEFFAAAAQQYAKNTACTYRPMFRTLSWTYEGLWSHAAAFARMLERHNIQKGDRVILAAANSPFWVAAFFAVQLKGAIAVPFSPESASDFIQKIIDQTDAKLILKNRIVDTGDISLPVVFIEDVPQASAGGTDHFLPDMNENDIAEIVYTSGTTGDPKGVVLTHKNLLSNVWAARKRIPPHHTMRFASILPLFHMFEQVGGLFIPLSAGAQISYASSLNPNHLKWIFEDDRINRMLAVPEFLRLLRARVREEAKERGKLARLRILLFIAENIPFMSVRRALFAKLHRRIGWRMHTIVSGGAALDKNTAEFWERTGIRVLQGYGLTETSPVLTACGWSEGALDSVGRPLDGVSIKIAEDGEILAKGSSVFGGYWNNEEKTREAFTSDGWLKTGDMGFFDKKGRLYLKGRKKFMIVLPSGENVYAEDVEAELNKESGVTDSAVIGLKKDAAEEVHAVLLLNAEALAEPKHIIDQVNQRLMPYQRIKTFSIWPADDFPRTPTRKVKKREVMEQVAAQLAGRKPQTAPPPNLSKLERIVAQVLEVPSQDIQDDKRLVADFNLDSLRRIELVARIENELSVPVDESEITRQTTVKDLQAIVAEKHQKQIRYPFNPKPFGGFAVFFRTIVQSILLKPAVSLFTPMEIRGLEHLKDVRHPALFFSNHLGAADAPVLYGALPARFRGKLAVGAATDVIYESEAWWIKHSRWFLELLFPVFPFIRYEGQTKSSFAYTGRIMDRGFSVLLFPEGRTSPTSQLLPFKQGAGLLALEMAVSIVPVKLQGTQHIFAPKPESETPLFQLPKRSMVTITFGEPFKVSRHMTYREATSLVEQKIREL